MTNPLLETWTGPFGLPPFDRFAPEHFEPAFDAAMAAHLEEIDAITANGAAPDFSNTIEAMERAGQALSRVAAVFYTLAGSHTNDALQAVERAMAPRLAAHRARVMMNPALFARVEAVDDQGLDAEQRRVLKLTRERFVMAGARLQGDDAARMRAIMERLSTLGTAFGQNVLADESGWTLELDEGDLDGLPEPLVDAARREATERKLAKPFAITLARSSVEPFLTYSERRDLRETAWRAWSSRGEGSNWPVATEVLGLRAERARLLGFANFAELKLHDQMAKTPERVRELLMAAWEPAVARAGEEAEALQALAAEAGANLELSPWDWRFYAEKLRRERYAVDESETRPYLALDQVIDAAFDVASRLFGLAFEPVNDLPLHHPDARAFEVKRADGSHLGLFIGDYFARPSKRSGAWMNELRGQQGLWEPGRPIVLNTLNLVPGGADTPALLTLDDARTVFHEFGHALHGLLSDVRYPSVAGTRVARDFVELPSQLFEHWLTVPEVLAKHARHYQTGEAMPAELIERLRAAATFNQGFATVEYTACALVDLEMHELGEDALAGTDAGSIERATLERIGMPDAIGMRHRSPHFLHVFTGDGYSAGYYSYLWSETMDADAFRAFEEAGDAFDAATAQRLLDNVYSAGGAPLPEDAYVAFRGRLPGPEALLEGRGLVPA